MSKLIQSNRNNKKLIDRGTPIKPKETFSIKESKPSTISNQYIPKPASMKIDSEIRDKINALSLIGIGENQKEVVDRALTLLIDSLTNDQQRTYENQFDVLRKRTIERESQI